MTQKSTFVLHLRALSEDSKHRETRMLRGTEHRSVSKSASCVGDISVCLVTLGGRDWVTDMQFWMAIRVSDIQNLCKSFTRGTGVSEHSNPPLNDCTSAGVQNTSSLGGAPLPNALEASERAGQRFVQVMSGGMVSWGKLHKLLCELVPPRRIP